MKTQAKTKQKKNNKSVAMLIPVAALALLGAAALIVFGRPVSGESAEGGTDVKTVAVRTQAIAPAGNSVSLSYVGAIEPEKLHEATYPGVSTVEKVYVTLGQDVKKGQKLATVDTENAQDQLDVASNSLSSARSAQSTAQGSYNRADADLTDAKTIDKQIADKETEQTAAAAERDAAKQAWDDYLLQGGGDAAVLAQLEAEYNAKLDVYNTKTSELNALKARKSAMDSIAQAGGSLDAISYYQAQRDTASAALSEANSALSSAQINYDSAVKALNDCTLKSEIDGYVVALLASEGGIATPINPLVIVGAYDSIVSFGASASDVRDLQVGQACVTAVGSQRLAGEILEVGVIPDTESRTYEVHVSLPQDSERYLVGEIVNVSVDVGERYGVWIPIVVIMNDGEDYVFVVEDGRAVKKTVVIGDIANDLARVTGLEAGGRLVVEGMKSLRSGDLVSVVE